jgi:hypothetical protein
MSDSPRRASGGVVRTAFIVIGAVWSGQAQAEGANDVAPAPTAAAASERTPVAANDAQDDLPLVAPVLRLGLLAYGRGEEKNGCSGACTGFAPDNASYSHGPALGIGGEALFTVFRQWRFGPSLFYVLPNHVDIDGASGGFGIGSDLTLDAAAEFAPRIARHFRILPRIQGGLLVLFPDGELKSSLEAVRTYCPSNVARGCGSLGDTVVGWNLAVGAGALYSVLPHLRLRVDVLAQYYSVGLYDIGASLLRNSIDVSERLSGARLFVTVGAEY